MGLLTRVNLTRAILTPGRLGNNVRDAPLSSKRIADIFV